MLLTPQHKKSARPAQNDTDSFFKPRAQAKLKVNKPGDQHEVEADAMAETVVEKQQVAPKVNTPTPNLAQAKPDEEQSVQTTPEEEEAQASEDQTLVQGAQVAKATEDEPVQAMAEQAMDDEEVQAKLQDAPILPTKPSPADTLTSTKGGGSALGESTKAQMEQGFGTDFSAVRIHTDSKAEEMTKGAGAQAFTHKKDIYFNKGKFQPETKGGQKLIAHELTHTIQQGATPEQKPAEEATPASKSSSTSESAVAMPAATEIPAVEKANPAAVVGEALAPEKGKEKPGEAKGDIIEGEKEIPDGPPVIRDPKANPGFQKTVTNINTEKTAQVDLEDPEALSSQAQSAAPTAANERMGSAQANQVEEMEKAEPEEFNAETFKAMLMSRIAEMQLPTNNEEADEFEENNNIDEVNKKAVGDVNKEKDAAAGPIEQSKEKSPDPSAVPERKVETLVPPNPGKKPGKVGAKAAVPNKRPESEVSKPIVEETARMDNTMAENKVTDEQLEKSQEPTFQEALTEKNSAKEQAAQAPADLRKKEQGSIRRTGAKGDQKSDEQLLNMNTAKGAVLKQVEGGQKETGTKDTSERGRIAGEINKIYDKTKKAVTTILDNLETKVTKMFEKGAEKAKKIFEGYVALKMAAYKRRRYGGLTGPAKWTYDLFAGLPDEVNRFFTEGRKLFIKAMDIEITKIAKVVAADLNAAKQKIQDGKQEVKEYVDELPKDLKKFGKEAADDINDKFDELQDDVNSKQEALVDTLAQQYVESLQEVDARIEEMKEANKGLIDSVMGFIDGVIETINKLRELVNSLLEAIASVLDIIMADPIGFMADLFHGIGKGIDAFKANITKHLLGGLIGWLTGALGPMGITIPDDIFSLKGIFNLVMQVLGLGWDYLRLKAVKMMGEKVVGTLEKGWDVFKIFATKGIDGIWEYLKDTFSDLKETVLDAIQGMLITQVIEAGIKWLLSLLIPGAGFIKAIMAIKDVIVFFVESAIMLIPAIIEAILALAAGSIAGVGKAIEKGLSMLLPLVINLFAKLIGLGGLSKKVMKIFKKIRKRIDKAVNKILAKAKKAGRKLMRKLGIGKKKDAKKNSKDPDKQSGVKIENQKFVMHKNKHTIKYVNGEIIMKSKEGRLVDKIKAAKKFVEKNPDAELINGKQDEIKNKLIQLEKDRKSAQKATRNAQKRKEGDAKVTAIKDANALNADLANDIQAIGNKYKLVDLQAQYGTEEFDGELKVGLHTLTGKDRESHHVAENKFMEQTKVFYGTMGKTLKANPNYSDIGDKLIEREKGIQGRFSGGNNLSAILLHKNTHRLAEGKAIHSIGLQPSAMKNIIDDAKANKAITVVGTDSGTKTKRAQMSEGAWNSFIKKVYQMTAQDEFTIKKSDQQLVIKSEGSDENAINEIANDLNSLISTTDALNAREISKKKDTILDLINVTAKNAFNSALRSGLNTVKAALSKSTVDGKVEDHPKALAKLSGLAKDIWGNNIINKITK